MGIRIARDARARWREGNLVFVVRSKAETADLWLDSPGMAPAMADRIVATIAEGSP